MEVKKNSVMDETVYSIVSILGESKFGGDMLGVGGHAGNSYAKPVLRMLLSNDVDQAGNDWAKDLLKKIDSPFMEVIGLQIDLSVGTLLAESHTVIPDTNDEKSIKVSIIVDESTSTLEMLIREKVIGDYADIPAGKILAQDLKEYSCAANGTSLGEL